MKVSIKTTSGEFYQVTIPNNATINDLKLTAIVASNSLKASQLNLYNLYFKGIKLDLLKCVSDYTITDNDLIIIGSKKPSNSTDNHILEEEAFHLQEAIVVVENNADSPVVSSGFEPVLEENTEESKIKKEVPQAAASVAGVAKRKKGTKNSKKCNFASCNNNYLRIIGSCQDCEGNFCSKHRLMESHLCSGLKNFKKIAYNRNANKLHSEQTISNKV